MFKKYYGVSDEDLILIMKKGENDAESELFDRFQVKARILARSIYRDFKTQTYLDADDLINCALLSVFKAAKRYDNKSSFKTYWSAIAKNDIMDLIKRTSDSFANKRIGSVIPMSEEELSYFASPSENEYDDTIESLISKIKLNSSNISDLDLDVIRFYLYGYSLNEISSKCNLTYGIVRKKIDTMKLKIAKILLHS